jgi:HEAT repeat protein
MPSDTDANQTKIAQLIEQLEDEHTAVRSKAREELVQLGGQEVTRALVYELNDPRRDVRWEATKALSSIADPIAAPALVHLLQDEDDDVRWLAAEGLASLGDAGLLATLSASIRNARDTQFCRAAHHAFKEFSKHTVRSKDVTAVIEACESAEPGVALPVAAYHALLRIKTGKTE